MCAGDVAEWRLQGACEKALIKQYGGILRRSEYSQSLVPDKMTEDCTDFLSEWEELNV